MEPNSDAGFAFEDTEFSANSIIYNIKRCLSRTRARTRDGAATGARIKIQDELAGSFTGCRHFFHSDILARTALSHKNIFLFPATIRSFFSFGTYLLVLMEIDENIGCLTYTEVDHVGFELTTAWRYYPLSPFNKLIKSLHNTMCENYSHRTHYSRSFSRQQE